MRVDAKFLEGRIERIENHIFRLPSPSRRSKYTRASTTSKTRSQSESESDSEESVDMPLRRGDGPTVEEVIAHFKGLDKAKGKGGKQICKGKTPKGDGKGSPVAQAHEGKKCGKAKNMNLGEHKGKGQGEGKMAGPVQEVMTIKGIKGEPLLFDDMGRRFVLAKGLCGTKYYRPG